MNKIYNKLNLVNIMKKRPIIMVFICLVLASSIGVYAQEDKKALCEASDGNWIDGECVCPPHGAGFLEGFGCDYQTEPKAESSNFKMSPLVLILTVILFIIIIIIIKLRFRKK